MVGSEHPASAVRPLSATGSILMHSLRQLVPVCSVLCVGAP